MGLRVRCATKEIKGDATELVEGYIARAGSMVRSGTGREVFVAVGEPTLPIPEEGEVGQGGRSQHLALLMAKAMQGENHMAFLAAGTDGTDGPTNDAGGIVNGKTLGIGKKSNLVSQDFLNNADAGNYLEKTDSLITTGPTGTNVMDIILALKT